MPGAKCEYFGLCGGCQNQHIDPTEQIQIKQAKLIELFTAEKLNPTTFLDPITGPLWNYRRKARLGVKYVAKKEKVLVGFREKNKGFLTDMDTCEVLHSSVSDLIPSLKTMIAELEAFKTIPQIEVACGDEETALVFRHLKPLSISDTQTLKAFAKAHGIHLYLQPKGIKTVHLIEPENHEPRVSYDLPDFNCRFKFHPMDFVQVNADINQKLVAKAVELLDLKNTDTVLDVFCGLGNFSLPLATQAKHEVGVEGSGEMIDRANENATLNNVKNTSFFFAPI